MLNWLFSSLSYYLGGGPAYPRRQNVAFSDDFEPACTTLAHMLVKEIYVNDATRRLAYLREQLLANAKVHYQTKHVDIVATIEYYREDLAPSKCVVRHIASIVDGRDGKQEPLLQDASQWKRTECGTKTSYEELEIAMRGLLWRIAEEMGGEVKRPYSEPQLPDSTL